MGGGTYQRLPLPAEVSPLDAETGRGKSEHRNRSQSSGTGLRDSEVGATVPGARSRTDARNGKGEADTAPCETTAAARGGRGAGRGTGYPDEPAAGLPLHTRGAACS